MLTLLPDMLAVRAPSYPDVTLAIEDSDNGASSRYFVTSDEVILVLCRKTVTVNVVCAAS